MPLTPPLSLYVHIPWCVRKCPYCDFNSHNKNQGFNEPAYVETLLLDLERSKALVQQERLHSIFFGGGTPSLFSAASIKKIIQRSSDLFDTRDIEITLEANPGTFEQEKFSAFRDAGINRLSIGIQSFDSSFLHTLGRIHDGQQAFLAVNTAKKAGFENINLDLMYGLPSASNKVSGAQTVDQAVEDITIACEHNVNHISHYQLTIESNTYFDKHTPVLPDLETLWEIQTQCQQTLVTAGYKQYEVSAYAKEDKQCRHNLNYWQFGDYLGIGAGAHSKFSNSKTNTVTRQWKYRQPAQYISKNKHDNSVSGSKVLDKKAIVFDFLLNALRLKYGCSTELFENHTNLDFKTLRSSCMNIDPDLLRIDTKTICTSDKGFIFLDDVLVQLI